MLLVVLHKPPFCKRSAMQAADRVSSLAGVSGLWVLVIVVWQVLGLPYRPYSRGTSSDRAKLRWSAAFAVPSGVVVAVALPWYAHHISSDEYLWSAFAFFVLEVLWLPLTAVTENDRVVALLLLLAAASLTAAVGSGLRDLEQEDVCSGRAGYFLAVLLVPLLNVWLNDLFFLQLPAAWQPRPEHHARRQQCT